MTDDTRRSDDWTGEDWAGEDRRTTRTDAATDGDDRRRWNKTEYVGDQGEGAPGPVDPTRCPRARPALSGNRHPAGESHWAGTDAEPATGDRPLDRRLTPRRRDPDRAAAGTPAAASCCPREGCAPVTTRWRQRFTKS